MGKQVSRPGMRYSRWSRAACGSRDPTSQGSSTASSLPSRHQLSVAATTQPDTTRLMKAVPAASANPERASRVREAGQLRVRGRERGRQTSQPHPQLLLQSLLCGHWSALQVPGEEPAAAAAAKLLQLCPTLCDPIDGSPPGSPVPGILQARTLE